MGLLNKVKSGITKTLDTLTVAVAHPIATTAAVVSKKSTVNDVINKHFAQSTKEQVKDIVVGTAGLAAATITAGTTTGRIAALKAAKSVVPKSTTGKIVAAVAVPAAVGAVVRQPEAVTKAVVNAPVELGKFGGDVADFAANPSISSAKQIVTESPVISTALAAGAVIAAGKTAAPVIGGLIQKEAVEEQTKALEKAIETPLPTQSPSLTNTGTTTAPAVAPQTPLTPQTKPLIATAGSSTSTRKKRRSKRPSSPSVRQSVNIVVSNRASSTGIRSTKRLINKEVLPL